MGATTVHVFSDTLDKVWGSVGVVLGVFTFFGNILVFLVLIRITKRTLTDTAFINLAIIDVVSGLSAVAGSAYLINNRLWLYHPTWESITCYFTGMCWNTASLTTPLLVSLVSLGRAAAVYIPLRYDQVFTPTLVYITITYCWLHGLVASCLSIMGDTGNGRYVLYKSWGYCDQSIKDAFSNASLYKGLYIAFFTVPMILTCICIVLCNLLVMWKIVLMKLRGQDIHAKPRISRLSIPSPRASAQYLKRVHEKVTRRLSTNAFVSNGATHSTASETSFSNTQTQDSNVNNYRHFEIVSIEEHSVETNGNSFKVNKKVKKGTHRLRARVHRRRKAKRENRAILMTLFVSLSYLVCYLEIINFYISASFGGNEGLFGPMFGGGKYSTIYTNLWYYYSLFVAAFINAILHFLFNQVIRRGVNVFMRRPSITTSINPNMSTRNWS